MNTAPQPRPPRSPPNDYIGGRVLARKEELERALAVCDPADVALREAIEFALATVEPLLTGDLAHPSAVVAYDLNLWLERHKYLAQDSTTTAPEYVGRAHGSSTFTEAYDAHESKPAVPVDGEAQDHTLED